MCVAILNGDIKSILQYCLFLRIISRLKPDSQFQTISEIMGKWTQFFGLEPTGYYQASNMLKAVFRIRIRPNADPDPGFYLRADLDPAGFEFRILDSGFLILIMIQGFFQKYINYSKTLQNSSFSCTSFFFSFIIPAN